MLANVLCTFLHAVLLLQLQVLFPEGVDGVNHDLDQLDLGVSQPVLVGDVVGVASLTTGLSTGAAGLHVELLTASLQLVNAVLGPAGKVHVDGGPHAGAEVRGAGVDVAVLLHTGNSEVPVSGHEEEMVVNQLLSDGLVHPGEGVVLTSQVAAQLGQSVGHQLLHVNSLLLGDSGGQTESVNVATNTDTG